MMIRCRIDCRNMRKKKRIIWSNLRNKINVKKQQAKYGVFHPAISKNLKKDSLNTVRGKYDSLVSRSYFRYLDIKPKEYNIKINI